ncbi:hypothetical protein HN709_00875 [Candidatus Peregrinibacteria bacterium]|jgi:hypothetical protein|nr:hypothetical protein [Candidatus Peregrinibacteria bacterium]
MKPDTERLGQIISSINPEKADDILEKYHAVKDATSGATSKHIDEITGELFAIDDQNVSEPSLELKKVMLVESLAKELDLIAVSEEALDEDLHDAFQQIEVMFADKGFERDLSAYFDAYRALPKDMRIPIDVIVSGLENLFKLPVTVPEEFYVVEHPSHTMSLKVNVRTNDILMVFGMYCNGELAAAEDKVSTLLDESEVIGRANAFREKTNLKKLPHLYLSALLSTLEENGIDMDQAAEYIGKLEEMSQAPLAKGMKLSPLNLDELKLHPSVLVPFVVKSILTYREWEKSQNAEHKAGLHALLYIEARTSADQAGAEEIAVKSNAQFVDLQKEMAEYRKAHPDVMYDKKTVDLESKMTVAAADLFKAQLDLNIAKVRYDLAVGYLSRPNIDPADDAAIADLNELLNTDLDYEAADRPSMQFRLFAQEHKIDVGENILAVEVFETKFLKSKIDFANASSKEKPGAIKAYNSFLSQSDEAYDRTPIYEDLKRQADDSLHIFHYMSARVAREHKYFDELNDNYGNIENVPETEKQKVAAHLATYMMLLEDHYDSMAKIVGTLSLIKLLGVGAYDLPKSVLPDFHVFLKGLDAGQVYAPEGDANADEQSEPIDVEPLWFPMPKKGLEIQRPLWPSVKEDGSNAIDGVMAMFETSGEDGYNELMAVANFLGATEYKPQDFEAASVTNLHLAYLSKEINPFNADELMGPVVGAFEGMGEVNDELAEYMKDPSFIDTFTGSEHDLWLKVNAKIVPVLNAIDSARSIVRNDKSRFEAMLEDVPEGYKDNPRLLAIRNKALEDLIDMCDSLLTSYDSPISDVSRRKITNAQEQIYNYFIDRAWGLLKAVGATIVVIGSAVALAVGFAPAGSTFGAGIAALTPGVVAGGTAAKIITFTSTMAFVSAGGVVGSRIGLMGTNALGLTDMSMEQIWDVDAMKTDFLWGFALSMVACGSARLLMMGLHKGALPIGTAGRTGIFARMSPDKCRWLLGKMEFVNILASPDKWLKGGRPGAGYLKHWGVEFAQESLETGVQTSTDIATRVAGLNAMGPLGQFAGFIVAFASSADGINPYVSTKVTAKTIAFAEELGLTLENGNIAYMESISDLSAKFKSVFPGLDFTFEVNAEGVVSVKGIDPQGNSLKLDVHPSGNSSPDITIGRMKESLGLEQSPDVTIGNMEGSLGLEQSLGASFKLSDPSKTFSLIAQLRSKGFVLLPGQDNSFIAKAGDYEIRVVVDPEVIESVAKFEGQLDTAFSEVNAELEAALANPNLTDMEMAALEIKWTGRILGVLALAPTSALAKGAPSFLTSPVEWAEHYTGELFAGVSEGIFVVGDAVIPGVLIFKTLFFAGKLAVNWGGTSRQVAANWDTFKTQMENRFVKNPVRTPGNVFGQSIQGKLSELSNGTDPKLGAKAHELLMNFKGQGIPQVAADLRKSLKIQGVDRATARPIVNNIVANLKVLESNPTTSTAFTKAYNALNADFIALSKLPNVSLPLVIKARNIIIWYLIYRLLRGSELLTGEKVVVVYDWMANLFNSSDKKSTGSQGSSLTVTDDGGSGGGLVIDGDDPDEKVDTTGWKSAGEGEKVEKQDHGTTDDTDSSGGGTSGGSESSGDKKPEKSGKTAAEIEAAKVKGLMRNARKQMFPDPVAKVKFKVYICSDGVTRNEFGQKIEKKTDSTQAPPVDRYYLGGKLYLGQ